MNKRVLKNLCIYVFIPILISIIIYIVTGSNNLGRLVQIIKIINTVGFSYLCLLHVKRRFNESRYSYKLIISLAFLIFLILNLFRMSFLLIENWNLTDASITYKNTLESFSYFAIITVPFVLGLSIYSMITNILLIKHEGLKAHNVLGIVFAIITIIAALSGQVLFEIYKNINLTERQTHIKIFLDMSLNSVLSYYYALVLSTLYCNIMANKHKPTYDKDFIIILGCRVNDDGTLSPLLKSRVDKAIEFAKEQKKKNKKDIIFIPSGGKGSDEVLSEAKAMKNYLVSQGIKAKNIVIEDASTNTEENMKFSKKKIEEISKDAKIIYATSDYHVFRSGVLAEEQGLKCEGIGSTTKWWYYSNALIREFVANVMSRKKEHITIVAIIDLSILALVYIGHKYNLI